MENELGEKNFADKKVVLHITSAYGFSLVKGFISIEAKFGNVTCKTPDIFVDKNELKFDSKLVWCMTNKILKNLRMSYASVKVECFHKPINNLNATVKLGYLFLQVKGAQTICPKSNERVDRVCYKLIGSKNSNYSLTMSLTIEDYCSKVVEMSSIKTKKLNNENAVNKDQYSPKEKEKKEINEKIDTEIKEKIDTELPTNYVHKFADRTDNFTDINKAQNYINLVVRQKLIDLELWESEQKCLFKKQMKKTEEQLVKEFNKKWSEEKQIIEKELTQEISTCKAWTENLNKIVDELIEQKSILTSKEELANRPIINDLNEKVTELEETNVLLRIENDQLRRKVWDLENKCDQGYKSSMFFKEKWIKAVRKINQIYDKQYQNKSLDDMSYKQDIQNILTSHVVEQKHDEEKLSELLNEFSKLQQELTQ